VLGGVRFEGETALHGHSDADVISHAVGEALLGAAGLGDLGSHFPDTDERWRGADSLRLLDEILRLVRAEGWAPVNVDCSVIAERPKLAGRRDEMQTVLSARVGAPVTVKGRRAEGIGYWGLSSVAAIAVAPTVGFWIYQRGWLWLCVVGASLNLMMAVIALNLRQDPPLPLDCWLR
jgi:2-C-methyl-D-erythritol 2,4-cyclodiphosphate synthase